MERPSRERTHNNPLRPGTFDEMIGQARAIAYLRRVVGAAKLRGRPLDHLLMTGPAGVGKSTIAHVLAAELEDAACWPIEAPVSHETLRQLRISMFDGDILFIDEIHQQAIMERRGRSTNTQPEVLFSIMEDRTMVSGTALLTFPHITIIGATTDEGMLPTSFIDRFPLRPVLEPYALDDLALIALANADALGIDIEAEAAQLFAGAARGVPRQINNYVRNAESLVEPGAPITLALAQEVVHDLNYTTEDGLNRDMQGVLTFLYTRCKRTNQADAITYQASISTLATAIGKSRDTKAIVLRVEPYLIEQGYLQVGHGGRKLTPAGVRRARQLIKEQ